MNDNDFERCECGFETDDIFEMFEHCEMDLVWSLKISPSFSFNLYAFMRELSRLARTNRTEEIDEALQSFTYLMFNASEDMEIESKLKDLFIKKESEQLIEDLERMLDNNG